MTHGFAAKHRPALVPAPNGLHLVPLDLVEIEAQERKTSGLDAASLAELAESIKRDGLMQPPLLRWKGSRLIVVAGERRVRACRLAGLAAVHAIVGDADDNRARLLRLAENHQRENLTTAETAAAVKQLADEGMSLAEIAAAFSKSKAWASKHLGISRDDFSQRARFLLEHGACEDLEKLHILSQLELATPTKPARLDEIAQTINELSRAELRLILKKAKSADADEGDDDEEDAPPTTSAKPPSSKTAKLQLDQHTATVILEAVRENQRRKPTTTTLEALDFLETFVRTTWPDAMPKGKSANASIERATAADKRARSIRYRDPQTGASWSGRGLQPAWLKAAMAKGAKLADFVVEGSQRS
jgi:ParB/RepB/Spo0J family partition protein